MLIDMSVSAGVLIVLTIILEKLPEIISQRDLS